MQNKKNIKEIIIVLIIPIIFFLYAIFTISDYGINWDEPYHFRRGQAFLQYYLTGDKTYNNIPRYPPLKGTSDSPNFRNSQQNFEDVQNNPSLSDPNYRRSYYQDQDWNGEYHIDQEDPAGHPALNGILAALFNKVFFQKLGIIGDLESYHLFEISVSSLLVFAIAIFIWKEYGLIESLVSSLVISTYPLFLGEQHFNIKDPIEAFFYTITLISVFKAVTRKKISWLIISILSFALGISVKFNIVFIIFPILGWLILYLKQNRDNRHFNKKFLILTLLSPFIVTGLFILFFPTLWKNPVWGIERVVGYYLSVGYSLSQPLKYYYFGFINSYPIVWILYTTPIPTLLLFLSVFLFPKRLPEKKYFTFLLLLALITTIGRVTFFGALSYGGVRIIMEFIPILAMLCGIGAGYIYKKINIFPLIILLILFIPLICRLIILHPNENIFFNFLAGGLAGAKEKEVNSWGNSSGNAYYPALLWINENAEPNARLTLPIGVISNIPRFKLRDDIALSADYWSGTSHQGEYVLELTYDYSPMQGFSLKYLNTAMKPVYEVKVDGIAIAKLWKNTSEYIFPEFKKQKEITANISIKNKQDYLELTLPNVENIMQATLTQPTTKCNNLETGYIDTSVDGKNWTREIEDIAREQLKHAKLRNLQPDFTFYFVAREAKYIRIHTDDKDSCILKAYNPKVTILENN